MRARAARLLRALAARIDRPQSWLDEGEGPPLTAEELAAIVEHPVASWLPVISAQREHRLTDEQIAKLRGDWLSGYPDAGAIARHVAHEARRASARF
jgi:hypothetical protein